MQMSAGERYALSAMLLHLSCGALDSILQAWCTSQFFEGMQDLQGFSGLDSAAPAALGSVVSGVSARPGVPSSLSMTGDKAVSHSAVRLSADIGILVFGSWKSVTSGLAGRGGGGDETGCLVGVSSASSKSSTCMQAQLHLQVIERRVCEAFRPLTSICQ